MSLVRFLDLYLRQLHPHPRRSCEDWWARYEDDGLVILGIHTPEFEFEKDYDNVVEALGTHEIGWPVAQDNRRVTWRNFENR